MSDILELIKNRRTIRKYQKKKIPGKVLEKIVEAGLYAPSAHNSQPWRFVVVENEKTIKRFVSNLEKCLSDNMLITIKFALKNCINIIKKAPVVILVYNTGTLSKTASRLGKVLKRTAYISEIQSIAAAIENMFLVSTALKIGMCWLTMPLLVEEKLKPFINKSDELMAILTLGYPIEKGKSSSKRPISEITHYIN